MSVMGAKPDIFYVIQHKLHTKLPSSEICKISTGTVRVSNSCFAARGYFVHVGLFDTASTRKDSIKGNNM